ncbi:BON domain-containing protein [Dyadobacter endophyticus]|uniref:BON domain-containing protein n=1 Tax=Dyadobacter endophyticus TaxID=1749036 RepID=UPI003CEB136D
MQKIINYKFKAMGLLSFIKCVGIKVFNKNETIEIVHPEAAEPLRASALMAHVKSLGLSYHNLTIKTSNDAVTLEGEVAKQEDSEKIALAIGNIEGVELVECSCLNS